MALPTLQAGETFETRVCGLTDVNPITRKVHTLEELETKKAYIEAKWVGVDKVFIQDGSLCVHWDNPTHVNNATVVQKT